MIYELTHSPGNVERILTSEQGEAGEHYGIVRAADAVMHATGIRPLWSRQPVLLDFVRATTSPSFIMRASSIGMFFVILVAWLCWWRRDPILRALLGTVLFAVGGATVSLARLPVIFGATYRMWSLWVIGSFTWFGFLLVLYRFGSTRWPMVTRPVGKRWTLRVAAVALGVTFVGFSIAGVRGNTPTFMSEVDHSRAITRLVDDARRTLARPGPYLAVQLAAGEGSGVIWGLARHGYDIRVSKEAPFDFVLLGEKHSPRGVSLRRLYVLMDPSPKTDSFGRLIASAVVRGTRAERDAYTDARRHACVSFRRARSPLTAKGMRAAGEAGNRARTPLLAALGSREVPCRLLDLPRLQQLIDERLLRLDHTTSVEMLHLYQAYYAARVHHLEVRLGPPVPSN